MVTKKTAAKSPAPKNVDDPNDYHAVIGEHGISNDMSSSQLRAILAVRTPMLASITLKAYALFGDGLGITELSHEMEKAGNEVVSGDMGQIERMLVNQSMTLNAIFNQLALKAEKTSFLKSMEVYMRLALKAQAQARSIRPDDGGYEAKGCPRCGYKPFAKRCMSCGHEKQALALVEAVPGEMQEVVLGKEKLADNHRHLWEQVCTHARRHSQPDKQCGRAFHLYKDITGKEPPSAWRFEVTPDVEITRNVRNKIINLNLAYSRRRVA